MCKKPIFYFLFSVLVTACGTEEKKITEAEQTKLDSLSKVRQKHYVDSLKHRNPLLIMPPDSNYSGDYIDKYPNGVIKYRGNYRFGLRHGQWVSFYNSGVPWSEQSYDKGKREGANVVYYENARLRYSGYYKQDKRDSVWMFYDSTGMLIKTLVYKEDKEISDVQARQAPKK